LFGRLGDRVLGVLRNGITWGLDRNAQSHDHVSTLENELQRHETPRGGPAQPSGLHPAGHGLFKLGSIAAALGDSIVLNTSKPALTPYLCSGA